MSEKKREGWPGLVPIVRRFFLGAERPRRASAPKVKHYGYGTPTTDETYEAMHKYYRWFRQDRLVRKCVVVNAMFSTLTQGFDTVLEAPEEGVNLEAYDFVKESIDAINKKVNMDQILFIAQIKRSIYGNSGFEIVFENEGKTSPAWLLPLHSDKLSPKLNEKWEIEGYNYTGPGAPSDQPAYEPGEVLYFVNLSLEADKLGLSDIEPIRDECKARHDLLRVDYPEITRTIWAPYVLLRATVPEGLTADQENKLVDDIAQAARSGRSLGINQDVEATVVNLTPDLTGLSKLNQDFEEAIIGNFGTPRFLVGKPIENRATAFAELEAYVEGPITSIQRYLKRVVEADWYDRWTREILKAGNKGVGEDQPLPVLVKHKWRRIRTIDIYEMAKAISAGGLYGEGLGPIADRLEKVWEMMGWDPSELEEEEK